MKFTYDTPVIVHISERSYRYDVCEPAIHSYIFPESQRCCRYRCDENLKYLEVKNSSIHSCSPSLFSCFHCNGQSYAQHNPPFAFLYLSMKPALNIHDYRNANAKTCHVPTAAPKCSLSRDTNYKSSRCLARCNVLL